ncbi:BREX-1 system adenine-specific DNA-methyltransferase PglX [Clostridium botulinum]|nr:BREX-1 system adenine-specific DNA-methyltransferase PglX [Clostridium botulinum]
MDKNKIKSFAIWARRSLIAAVSEKANRIGIYENKIEEATAVQGGFKLEGIDEIFPLSKRDRDALVSQVKEKGFEQVMEEVAYTWFNRFMGLRYMEVNDYLPSGVRILSSEVEDKKEPDVLTKVSEIIDELGLNANEIYDLLDTGNTIDREKAYRIILVKQCNELGIIIPQMFEKISDYTELLLPDNLLEDGSVIRKMVEDIEESDWKEEVEIIGWMYQYYISEKKDEVFTALKKNVKITKENIPAATQLFTPKWIVKYMVENSLGRLWLEGHPNEELQKEWKYYLEEAQQEPEVEEELKKIREEHSQLKPEDIKVLDPCMGSGHILVYAFDVLYEIYKTAGYSEREIPRMILQNNLYGLDIDDRAAQLASFALIMKARSFNRRLFREIEREHLELNLCSIQESNTIGNEEIDYFCMHQKDNNQLKENIEYLCKIFINAKEYGSILEIQKVDFISLKKRLKEIEQDNTLVFADYREVITNKLKLVIKQAEIMSQAYEVCITNPPYMGQKGMNTNLVEYTKNKYKDSKRDLFAIFIEKGLETVKVNGYSCMVTMQSWMFLSAFQALREKIISERDIVCLMHMDNMVMGIAFGTSVSILRKSKISKLKGIYNEIKYSDIEGDRPKKFPILENKFSNVSVDIFEMIPGMPIAYWVNSKVVNSFNLEPAADHATFKHGMSTSDNNRFLRLWFEVSNSNTNFVATSKESTLDKKWYPYLKGGSYRKWYGNNEYLVNWKNDGFEIKEISNIKYPYLKGNLDFVLGGQKYFFTPGYTWSSLTNGRFGQRKFGSGFIFDAKGQCFFTEDSLIGDYLFAIYNSKVFDIYSEILAPTMDFNSGVISKLPICVNNDCVEKVQLLVNELVKLSKIEWDSFEVSWDFKKNYLVELALSKGSSKIVEIFASWERECESIFAKVKNNEEELNRIFINIYGLEEDLTPEVDDKDITIRKANRERDIKSFISYAVGCMLGRYSIDAEGLIYAGGDFNDKWDFENNKVRKIEKDADGNIISDLWIESRFMPDRENIIPITEDEYFEDDIVSRFIDFVRTAYGNDNLEENLDFIADSIGRKSAETARQAIRRYFIKDFYKDHLKIYQKRPIYWMFESGKNDGFKALIYMHRYNDQTVAKVRTDYLHVLQRKYESEVNRLQLVMDSEEYTAKDRTAAKKKIARISKQLEECKEYDQVVAHLANEKISIDLDDGVKVNYAKFQGVTVINSKEKEVKMNLLAKI